MSGKGDRNRSYTEAYRNGWERIFAKPTPDIHRAKDEEHAPEAATGEGKKREPRTSD